MDSLIRSEQSCLGPSLVPGSQPLQKLLKHKASLECIDFIQKCLAFEPEDRMTPQAALHHKWLIEL